MWRTSSELFLVLVNIQSDGFLKENEHCTHLELYLDVKRPTRRGSAGSALSSLNNFKHRSTPVYQTRLNSTEASPCVGIVQMKKSHTKTTCARTCDIVGLVR